MLNKSVIHNTFGKGTIIDIIDRSASKIHIDENGEVKTIESELPNILVIEFDSGTVAQFHESALKNPRWFIQE